MHTIALGPAVLRGVFVLLGSALALALGLVAATSVAVLAGTDSAPLALLIAVGVVVTVAPIVVVGLVPAVARVEAAAAESLLGIRVPGGVDAVARTWPQRRRALAWFVLHLLSGVVPVAIVVLSLDRSTAPWGPALLLVAAALTPALGVLLTRAVDPLLGPAYADRLAALERDVARASERNRLAREIHDSVGHALSVITVQSAAARKVLALDPEFAGGALDVIEETSRAAGAELDHVLGLLRRDAEAAREVLPDLAALDALLHTARGSGLEVEASVHGEPAGLPPLTSREAYRIVQECLTNAMRHGGGARVRLVVDVRGPDLKVTSENRAGGSHGRGAGRGVDGMRERAEALGGRVRVTEADGTFRVEAALPLPRGI